MSLRLPPRVAELLGPNPAWSDDHEGRSGGVVRANGTYWVKRGAVAVAEFPRYRWLRGRSMAVPEIAVFEDDMLVLVDAGVPSVASVQPDSPGWDLGDDFGAGEVEAFFAAYGLLDPDPARLAYYRLLDELF
ncbi:hypothetical protein [Nocardia sp. NPDC051981]|uniref:hypothetical protein n=1 Tax=Nocardia sp. NPDC051981 TaxID=3155417 RepID=UPI0034432ABB